MNRKQEAIEIIEDVVLPYANRKLSNDSQVEYQVVESRETIGKKISGGVVGGEVVYIAPVNRKTGEVVVDFGLLTQLGIKGGQEQF